VRLSSAGAHVTLTRRAAGGSRRCPLADAKSIRLALQAKPTARSEGDVGAADHGANLVDNAVHYTPPGARRTAVAQDAGQIVADGRRLRAGIPARSGNACSDRFYRRAATSKAGMRNRQWVWGWRDGRSYRAAPPCVRTT